jgi:pilus assembly protein Flp/PilA
MMMTVAAALLSRPLSSFLGRRSERGATAVEYGLLLTGVVAMIVLVVYAFGDNVVDLFTDTCTETVAARGSGDCT